MAKKIANPVTQSNTGDPIQPTVTGKQKKLPFSRLLLLLFILPLLVYTNSCYNGFVLDDVAVIQQNTIVAGGLKAIPKILSTPYHQGFFRETNHDTSAVNDLYRPLSIVMFATERQFFDDHATPYHVFNIIIYSLCILVLFTFLDRLFDRKRTGEVFIATLLFALHPIHTEVVTNIKSLDELLCFLFAISALLTYERFIKTGKNLFIVTGSVFYLLSLMSKETSICFLAIIPFIFFFYINDNKKRSVALTVSSISIALIYIYIRFIVLSSYNANSTQHLYFIDNELIGAPSVTSRFATILFVMGYYIRLLIIPYPLVCDYSYDTIHFTEFSNIWVLISLFTYIFLFAIAIIRLRKYQKDPYAFGILFYLATIAIFSNLFFFIGATMAERFLFFPSVGFCWVIALLIVDFSKKLAMGNFLIPSKAWYFIIPVISVYSVLTYTRNSDWTDNLTLFKTDIAKFPENARLLHGIGSELTTAKLAETKDTAEQKRLIRDGISYLQKSIAIYSGDYKTHDDLGNLYAKLSMFDSAEMEMKLSIKLAPEIPVQVSDLGAIYYNQQKYRLAIEYCRKALALNPRFSGIWNNLSICYFQAKEYDSAIYAGNKVLEIDPDNKLASQIINASRININRKDTLK